ncbi:MAG: sugar-transfer associated ATP-grasp domain-containing protein [Candidatus Shapirobacteria bacterium]|nr:sugar-transfer associated ATP-grasp domain-containing protein [Candidatus Shapirobacteria bacterium]MDD4410206.1 sugar-transfer associated ATP-grasp domain-containing protein [Candidatus Shapirobacteria bacterium]
MFNLRKYRQFLTKNERNKVYLRKNSASGKAIADSKFKTKRIISKAGVSVPKLIARFKTEQDLAKFRWEDLEGNFVIKPESGYGGDGILIIRKRGKWAGEWQKMNGEIVKSYDLNMQCEEILAGKYSLHTMPDRVLIEERIKIHPMFLSLTKSGTPDIRVIVYNNVPVMAMFRIPTEKSGGKANLQQGAMGLGIDLATGITTFGIEGKGEEIYRIYDFGKKKNRKVNGIKIPFWREILETAINCQKAVPTLGFMGVDVVLDKEKGPMVLEVNARPGLSIQICNKAGLKARIEKVDGITVRSIDHAVTLAKYLFGESFFEKVEEKEKKQTVAPIEIIKVKIPKGFKPLLQKSPILKQGKHRVVDVRAKVDTGAFRSSIDRNLAEKLGLLTKDRILYYRNYKSSLGKHHDRPVIGITFWLNGRKVITAVNVADRDKLRTKFLLGRKDLGGFLVSAKK